jgi:hypothetical protein
LQVSGFAFFCWTVVRNGTAEQQIAGEKLEQKRYKKLNYMRQALVRLY